MKAQLTILGSRSGEPGSWGATAGYLVQYQNTTVLLDCGFGIPQILKTKNLLYTIDVLVISHLHADHVAGLLTLAYIYRIQKPSAKKVLVLLPPDGIKFIKKWQSLFSINSYPPLKAPFEDAFELQEYKEDIFNFQKMQFKFCLLKHAIPNYGLRLSGENWSLTYSGDTAFCDQIIALADGSNIFLCEATYVEEKQEIIFGHGHLTGIDAGIIAKQAKVKHLVLTHFSQESKEWLRILKKDASLNFTGTIDLALPGTTFITQP